MKQVLNFHIVDYSNCFINNNVLEIWVVSLASPQGSYTTTLFMTFVW